MGATSRFTDPQGAELRCFARAVLVRRTPASARSIYVPKILGYLSRNRRELIDLKQGSAGRAPRSQRGGQRFDPAQLHHLFNFPHELAATIAKRIQYLRPNP